MYVNDNQPPRDFDFGSEDETGLYHNLLGVVDETVEQGTKLEVSYDPLPWSSQFMKGKIVTLAFRSPQDVKIAEVRVFGSKLQSKVSLKYIVCMILFLKLVKLYHMYTNCSCFSQKNISNHKKKYFPR